MDLLRSMPTHIIPIPGAVLLKRGCTEFKVAGDRAAAVVRELMLAAASEPQRLEDLCDQFAEPDRPIVRDLIKELVERRILLPASEVALPIDDVEESEDIFYWHFATSSKTIRHQLAMIRLGLLGVNAINQRLAISLRGSGFDQVTTIDLPILRNLRIVDVPDSLSVGNGHKKAPDLPFAEWNQHPDRYPLDCLIATCDVAGSSCFREINALCARQSLSFMPVMLHNMVGTIGPFVIPGESPCYECFALREQSNLEDAHTASIFDQRAFEGQGVTGFHPVMTHVTAEVACFELIQQFGDCLPKRKPGTFLEINLLTGQMTKRRALKVPRCPVCGPVTTQSRVSISKALTDERTF